jgi:hypothetical protein
MTAAVKNATEVLSGIGLDEAQGLAPFVLLLGVWIVVADVVQKRRASKSKQRPTLSELRERASQQSSREAGLEFLERNTFVFVSISTLERRLDHRIDDADGLRIGSALQQPRPTRWASGGGRPSSLREVHVEICGADDVKVVEVVRARGIRAQPLQIRDRAGVLVGTIARDGSSRFALRDPLGGRIGTIERKSRGYAVDYALKDAADGVVGTISDFTHVARRLATPGLAPARPLLKRLFGVNQPDEHVLEITAPVTRDLRIVLLGAAAAVYLSLQQPFTDDG